MVRRLQLSVRTDLYQRTGHETGLSWILSIHSSEDGAEQRRVRHADEEAVLVGTRIGKTVREQLDTACDITTALSWRIVLGQPPTDPVGSVKESCPPLVGVDLGEGHARNLLGQKRGRAHHVHSGARHVHVGITQGEGVSRAIHPPWVTDSSDNGLGCFSRSPCATEKN